MCLRFSRSIPGAARQAIVPPSAGGRTVIHLLYQVPNEYTLNQILTTGQEVRTASSHLVCTVGKFLGGGGQGEVYQAKIGDDTVALKWYFPGSATREQLVALEDLVRTGPPNDKFLWPMELTKAAGVEGFGYVMPLRGQNYRGIVDLMKRRVDPTFRVLITASLQLAESYLQLHSKGLCYRDISFGNVFLDPKTGEARICDNDNVSVDGKAAGGVLGTPRFMAPEVVRGEKKPSANTDLFSLAVLLFYMLMMHHPLEGKKESSIKCLDLPAMNRLYGIEPLFIFDAVDQSNSPDPNHHRNALEYWPLYPQFLRDLFIRSFTQGMNNPAARVRESEWRAAMVRLRDSIVYCSQCHAESFYDAEFLKSNGKPAPCWSCHQDLLLPFRIRIGRNIVMLNHDTGLYPHHTDDSRLYDFSEPVAKVTRHPTNVTLWGLQNLSKARWVCTSAEGIIREVEPGRNFPIALGTKVSFGNTEGEIRR